MFYSSLDLGYHPSRLSESRKQSKDFSKSSVRFFSSSHTSYCFATVAAAIIFTGLAVISKVKFHTYSDFCTKSKLHSFDSIS